MRRLRDPDDRRQVIVEMVPERAAVDRGRWTCFAPLIADIEASTTASTTTSWPPILDYLSACNDAVERSTARLRATPRRP